MDNSLLQYDNNVEAKKSIGVTYKILGKFDDKEHGNHVGIIELHITAQVALEAGQFNVDMTMQGTCIAPRSMSDESFGRMLGINGCSAIYSVARGIVSSTSAQMLMGGSIILPLVNFVQFHEVSAKNAKVPKADT